MFTLVTRLVISSKNEHIMCTSLLYTMSSPSSLPTNVPSTNEEDEYISQATDLSNADLISTYHTFVSRFSYQLPRGTNDNLYIVLLTIGTALNTSQFVVHSIWIGAVYVSVIYSRLSIAA